jgi:hypothetical protein
MEEMVGLPSRRKGRRLAVILALFALLYFGAVIGFIIAY